MQCYGSSSYNMPVSTSNASSLSNSFRTTPKRSHSSLGIPTDTPNARNTSMSLHRGDIHLLTSQIKEILLEIDARPSSSHHNRSQTSISFVNLDSSMRWISRLSSVFSSFSSILTSWCSEASAVGKLSVTVLNKIHQSLEKEKGLRKQERIQFKEAYSNMEGEYKKEIHVLKQEIATLSTRNKNSQNSIIKDFSNRESELKKQLSSEKAKRNELHATILSLHQLFKSLKSEHLNYKNSVSGELIQLDLYKNKIVELSEEISKFKKSSNEPKRLRNSYSVKTLTPSISSNEIPSENENDQNLIELTKICPECAEYNHKLNPGINDLATKSLELETSLKLLGFDVGVGSKEVSWNWKDLGELVGRMRRLEDMVKKSMSSEGSNKVKNINDVFEENRKLVKQSLADSRMIDMLQSKTKNLSYKVDELEAYIREQEEKRAQNKSNFDLVTIDPEVKDHLGQGNSLTEFSRFFLFLPFGCLCSGSNQISDWKLSDIQLSFRKVLNNLQNIYCLNFSPLAYGSGVGRSDFYLTENDLNSSTFFNFPRISELFALHFDSFDCQRAIVTALNFKNFDSNSIQQQSTRSELSTLLKFLTEEFSPDVLLFFFKCLQSFSIDSLSNDSLPPIVDINFVLNSNIIHCLSDFGLHTDDLFDSRLISNNNYPFFVLIESLLNFYINSYQRKFIKNLRKSLFELFLEQKSKKVPLINFMKFITTQFKFLTISDVLSLFRKSILFSPTPNDISQENELKFSPFAAAVVNSGLISIDLFSKIDSLSQSDRLTFPLYKIILLTKPMVKQILDNTEYGNSSERNHLKSLCQSINHVDNLTFFDTHQNVSCLRGILGSVRSLQLSYHESLVKHRESSAKYMDLNRIVFHDIVLNEVTTLFKMAQIRQNFINSIEEEINQSEPIWLQNKFKT
ncbi:hypothetical protein P9112_007216 [Eukaryota sp. TZLM1-RC]